MLIGRSRTSPFESINAPVDVRLPAIVTEEFANLVFAKLLGIFPIDWSYIFMIVIGSIMLGVILRIKR